jgi:hypothetical protein
MREGWVRGGAMPPGGWRMVIVANRWVGRGSLQRRGQRRFQGLLENFCFCLVNDSQQFLPIWMRQLYDFRAQFVEITVCSVLVFTVVIQVCRRGSKTQSQSDIPSFKYLEFASINACIYNQDASLVIIQPEIASDSPTVLVEVAAPGISAAQICRP